MLGNRFVSGAALVLLVAVVYLPSSSGGFIWDDDKYVSANPALRSADGLSKIWREPGATPQYYPLVFTSFWMEYRLWALDPRGYHLVNAALHALNALLLWRVLRELQIPGAWFAAAVFGLHPVHVESVAWVTERKNVLSGFFYLAALLAYFRFSPPVPLPAVGRKPATVADPDPSAAAGGWEWYGIAVVLFVCALLSKTVTATLPAAIALLLWWKRGRVGRRDAAALAPLFILGIASGLMTVWVEKHFVGAEGDEWTLRPIERVLIAGRALWFYAGKLVWPTDLTFIYPRWNLDVRDGRQYLFPVGAVAVAAGLWLLRRRIGFGPLVALAFFAGTLLPALGFLNVYPMRYSFVADHFQYLASAGLIALAGALAARAYQELQPSRQWLGSVAGAVVLAVLGGLTWQQEGIYRDVETLWTDTLRKNPDCRMAHNNLGTALARQGRLGEAVTHLTAAIRIKPDDPRAHYNLGGAYVLLGQAGPAMRQFRETIRLSPDHARAHTDLGELLAGEGKADEAAGHFARALCINPDFARAHAGLAVARAGQGKWQEAADHFAAAAQLEPDDARAHANLVLALARLGKPDEAVQKLTPVLRSDPQFAELFSELGTAYVRQGKLEQALVRYRQAANLAPANAFCRYQVGAVLQRLGRPEEADATFREAQNCGQQWWLAASQAAWQLATHADAKVRDGALAVRLARDACAATNEKAPPALDALAAAQAEVGHFSDAAAAARKAVALATEARRPDLAQQYEQRLRLYESRQPFRSDARPAAASPAMAPRASQ